MIFFIYIIIYIKMQVNLITILLLILLLIIIYNYFISNNTENFTKCEELILNKNLINQKKLTLYIFYLEHVHIV
jgi:hypothetical protein